MRLTLLRIFLTAAVAIGSLTPELSEASSITGSNKCYASTSDWKAWVERTASGQRKLVVTGVVTTPTGGHRTALALGAVTRSDPPQQIVELELRTLGNIATMEVVTERVLGRFPALPRYGVVVVRCNGEEVARIGQIQQAK